MQWFKEAADQGHPAASYNLAIGHLKGIKTPINRTYDTITFQEKLYQLINILNITYKSYTIGISET